jgi:hypothetical protein
MQSETSLSSHANLLAKLAHAITAGKACDGYNSRLDKFICNATCQSVSECV